LRLHESEGHRPWTSRLAAHTGTEMHERLNKNASA